MIYTQARRQKFSEGGSFDTAGGLGALKAPRSPWVFGAKSCNLAISRLSESLEVSRPVKLKGGGPQPTKLLRILKVQKKPKVVPLWMRVIHKNGGKIKTRPINFLVEFEQGIIWTSQILNNGRNFKWGKANFWLKFAQLLGMGCISISV